MPIAYRTIDYGESDPFCPIPASEDDILPSLALSYTRDSDEDNEDARQYVFGIWIYMQNPRDIYDVETEPVFATSLAKAEEKVRRIFSRYPDVDIFLQGVVDPETGNLVSP